MAFSKQREAALLAAALNGDRSAFEDLVRPFRERIYWRAVKAVRDADEADDVTQEALIRAFTRLSTFRGEARFSSWLYMVASNAIRMHLRRRRRKSALPIDEHLHEIEGAPYEQRLGLTEQPDTLAIRGQLFGAIDLAISQLPAQYGSILRLWVEDGLDLQEIHERSGLSVAAIKSRLHRARRRLRDNLDSTYGSEALLAA
ncbi:MAG: sigma-70 family RNA polymerase sigma factor [Myxococcota bacterium]|nr:sigma-70 family RNA polymerase sigma factor [Myxococcota bacterium]